MNDTIAWVCLYPNKHVLDISSEIEKEYGRCVDYYFFRGITEERLGQGWSSPDEWTHIPSKFSAEYFRVLFRILKADVCVLFGSVDPFPWMFILFVLAANLRKKVYFISEGLRHQPSWGKRLVSRCTMNRKSVRYLCIGAGAAEDFYRMGMSKWTYRRFAFAEKYKKVRPFERPQKSEVTVLGVGRLIPRKNFSELIQVLSQYSGAVRVRVQIAGEGEERELLTKLAEDQLPDNVTLELLGLCDANELDEAFRRADIFAICSHYDGWGAVVNQALAYGLPIVASKSVRSAPGNLVKDHVNGRVYGNRLEFAESIFTLIDDVQLRRKMSAASFFRSCDWSVEQIALRLDSLFKDDGVKFESGILQKLQPTGKI